MFMASRDLVYAKGRFTLMVALVACVDRAIRLADGRLQERGVGHPSH